MRYIELKNLGHFNLQSTRPIILHTFTYTLPIGGLTLLGIGKRVLWGGSFSWNPLSKGWKYCFGFH